MVGRVGEASTSSGRGNGNTARPACEEVAGRAVWKWPKCTKEYWSAKGRGAVRPYGTTSGGS